MCKGIQMSSVKLRSSVFGLSVVLILISITLSQSVYSQSFVFGPKFGATFGTQNWNGVERNPLLAYHGGLFIESYREESSSSFLAYLGYHKKGSSEKIFGSALTSGGFTNPRQPFEFNNAVLLLGAKNRFNSYNVNKPYYIIGIRLEYTLSTNLERYLIYGGYFPLEPFVNKFNYGPLAGIGYELQFSEFLGGFIEASISPDISKQYEQPALSNIISPNTGQTRNIGEQTIRNITLEISIGIRLLRKVIIID